MATPAQAMAAARAAKVAELAEQARKAAPPPPPPPPLPPPSIAKQWRHPMADQWDRQVHAFTKRSGALAPPAEGTVRLYRAGAIPADSPPRRANDIVTDPFGNAMTRAQLDALKGPGHANPLEAQGRWFTNRPDELDFYIRENDTSPVYYVDVPGSQANQFNVANTPFSKNSRNPAAEFVLPEETANSATRLLDGLRSK